MGRAATAGVADAVALAGDTGAACIGRYASARAGCALITERARTARVRPAGLRARVSRVTAR